MGVPGFFAWLLKKYKNNNFIINKDLVQDEIIINKLENISYLLIDTNCLIHPVCFKIINNNQHITNNDELEKLMIEEVINYLNELIEYVKPTKGIYIAIDGVVPFAKIKQQRLRRFKTIYDNKLWDNIKKKYNKSIETKWNNNAITPGTIFMEKLHQRFISWINTIKKYHIIYSSYLTPKEGEHKLLEFIKNNNSYSYVIYGLDADLIFLALSTQLDNIYLLREQIEIFSNESKCESSQSKVLNYISIKIMKDCIFNTIINTFTKFNYLTDIDLKLVLNITNIINDFIFICYFLGNDFIPHIPSINIYNNGLEYLINNYVHILNNYYIEFNKFKYIINNKNKFNISFLNKLLYNLHIEEDKVLQKIYKLKLNFQLKYKGNDPYERELFKIENLQFKYYDPIKLGYDTQDKWRIRYYKYYWNLEDNEIEEFVEKIVKHYIYGLKWISLYYFDKCPSWDWYYPFDHPPFISDIYKYFNKTKINNIKFNIGKPIKPFMQLLIVLPKQSSNLLPEIFKPIVLDKKSLLTYLYPDNIVQDYLNKKKFWMAIPFLPAMNIALIKKIYNKYKNNISLEENKRNNNINIIELDNI